MDNGAITRNHSGMVLVSFNKNGALAQTCCNISKIFHLIFLGLANPVSRGGRKSKKEKKSLKPEKTPEPENEDWMKEEKFDADIHLDLNYSKHLTKNANK